MEITHESEQHRYVLSENGEFLGEVEYDRQGDTLHLATRFFPSAVLIPVFPPMEASTIAKTVVGI